MRKTTRKILATLLAFAMLFGTTLSVRAEGTRYTLNHNDSQVTGITVGQTLYGGDQFETIGEPVEIYIDNRSTGWIPPEAINSTYSLPTVNNYKVLSCECTYNSNNDCWLYIIKLEIITPNPSDDPSPSEPSSPSSKPSTEPAVPKSKPHEHSYSWETVQEATTEQDGIEEYRCSCGDVAERNVIPASQALVSGLFDIVKNASLNGVAQYDSGRLYTMSDYIIKKLAERSDVTTVITFEYNKTAYKMTIPVGVDYAAILADDDYFYGYFYFAKITGSTIEEIN